MAIKDSRRGREKGIFDLLDWAMNRLEPLRHVPGEGSPARSPKHGALRSWEQSPTGQTDDEPLASDSDGPPSGEAPPGDEPERWLPPCSPSRDCPEGRQPDLAAEQAEEAPASTEKKPAVRHWRPAQTRPGEWGRQAWKEPPASGDAPVASQSQTDLAAAAPVAIPSDADKEASAAAPVASPSDAKEEEPPPPPPGAQPEGTPEPPPPPEAPPQGTAKARSARASLKS